MIIRPLILTLAGFVIASKGFPKRRSGIHKNKKWQPYAAAYAKAVLTEIYPKFPRREPATVQYGQYSL